MTLIGKSSNALFFNGVSDGVLIPQAPFAKTGKQTALGKSYDPTLGGQTQNINTKISKASKSFSVEAWVVPDCGGVIASKEGVFELRIGDVSTPGPAQFTVHTFDEDVGQQSVTATTAAPVIVSRVHNGWDGVVYPTDSSVALHGTYNRFNTGKTDETALNRHSRELIYIVGVFTGQQVKLYVNGEMVASEKLNRETRSAHSSANLYIGGKGGEYRGTIEGVHWRRGFAESNVVPGPLLPTSDTIGLWRFEEPIEVPSLSLNLKAAASVGATDSGSALTVSNAEGKALIEYITGSTPTVTTTLDLTSSTYSNGKYQITTAGALQQLDHLPINLIINPTGVDEKTGTAYQTSPPERVRLKQLVWNADGTTDSTLTVYSIHLDFTNSTTTGLRGLLHAHAANDTTNQLAKGSTMAIINSDLLIDSGSGLPLRAPGQGTQVIDRTGQMVIDEAGGNHGFIFNTQMATDTTTNPFAFNWGATGLPVGFQAGHTGRHKFTHVSGHPYLRHLPQTVEEKVERNLDGDSDSFMAFFDGASMGLRNQVPLGSIMDIHRQAFIGSAINTESTSNVVQAVENGMAGAGASTQRQMIAIGGLGFDPTPFLLKGHAFLGEDGTQDTYDMHLTPEDTSRVAVLECAMGSDTAPYVEIHYNAIDLTGNRIQYAATGTATSATHATVISLSAGGTKAFGPHGGTFDAYYLICDGVRAKASTGTNVTISHGGNTLTIGSAADGGFQAKLGVGAVIYRELTGAALCVTKTVPDASSIISGSQVIDYIHTALASGATLHAPGGMITISDDALGSGSTAFKSHRMVGDNTGGTTYEMNLDNSLIPANHVPQSATDEPQSPPSGIIASHVLDAEHSPVYHKLVIQNSKAGTSDAAAENSTDPAVVNAPDTFRLMPIKEAASNANGVFDTPTTNHRTNLFEMFDVIDNWPVGKNHVLIIQPTDRLRTMQLTKFASESTQENDPNFLSVEFLQCRGRVKDFREKLDDRGRQIILRGIGLVQDIKESDASLLGDASPDSHGVKEIVPGGPVVAVSLGGPGQGAVDTKPTYDPSPMARIGWNTRRNCGAVVQTVVTGGSPVLMTITPLNNQSANLASWGHMCFPESGGSSGQNHARIYLQSGASAAYYDISSGAFLFDTSDANMAGWFVNADGSMETTIANWLTVNAVTGGTIIYNDRYIGEDTVCMDGTTVQDRMFQKLNSVTHDYQLGTQYASTRALVEIPVFPYQFFEDGDEGIFPGPDNSMKLTLDATMTAHTWNPKPVGRRLCGNSLAKDPQVMGPYGGLWAVGAGMAGTPYIGIHHTTGTELILEVGDASRWPQTNVGNKNGPEFAGIARGGGVTRTHRVFTRQGDWAIVSHVDYTNNRITIPRGRYGRRCMTKNFLSQLKAGIGLFSTFQEFNSGLACLSNGNGDSMAVAQGFESEYYYDNASVQTQGSGLDYGLKQYVSAVEFKAGPEENPHLAKLQTGAWRGKVVSYKSNQLIVTNAENFPPVGAMLRFGPVAQLDWRVRNLHTEEEFAINWATYGTANNDPIFTLKKWSNYATATLGVDFKVGHEFVIMALEVNANNGAYASYYPKVMYDAVLNKEWLNPYAAGGLREGDTMWMNMHYTNPHATDGMFCKSRGVANDWEVHHEFNGGRGHFDVRSRHSIPMENFLIGNTCRKTAENFAQHVNQTIQWNLEQLGTPNPSRIVAFVDPYLSKHDHARVLLYDVQGDREFISFHDLHMQVQSSPDATQITNLDVAHGFSSQQRDKNLANYEATGYTDTGYNGNPKIRHDRGRSTFIEGAYNHSDVVLTNPDRNNHDVAASNALGRWSLGRRLARNYEEYPVQSECASDRITRRTQAGKCCTSEAEKWFAQGIEDYTDAEAFWGNQGVTGVATTNATTAPTFSSFMLDTPQGTRTVSAFLCLKGIRAIDSTTTDARLTNLPHWKQMDFTRRLTIDLGEVGVKEGITNIEAAAHEIVRLINQAGAKKGRSNIRRPPDQFPGTTLENNDPAQSHINADYAVTGSTHDPASFWDDSAFASYDRGSHMGYLRAHVGRVIEDVNGVEGFTIVIHSTIPGATGRNFCVWMDNSKAQSDYSPQFLIGHGGRFDSFYCQPMEIQGENMHPAPMPLNKHGRPFAPITTLHSLQRASTPTSSPIHVGTYIPPSAFEETTQETPETPPHQGGTGHGGSSNTVTGTVMMPTELTMSQGLGTGSTARAQINFGGLVASGVPGWSPDLGDWGFGDGTDARAHKIYNADLPTQVDYTNHVASADRLGVGGGQIYGIRFEDHLGRNHTVRMLYKEYGQTFSNRETVIPTSLDNEVVIWFDDRDISSGGFTIGRHMKGSGDIGGRIVDARQWKDKAGGTNTPVDAVLSNGITSQPYCGNRWRGVPSSKAAFAVTLDRPAGTSLSLQYDTGTADSFGKIHGGIWHDLPFEGDALGHMGFPKTNGVIQLTMPISHTGSDGAKHGNTGHYLSYTHRTENTKKGPHTFHGVTGIPTELSGWGATTIGPTHYNEDLTPALISPTGNWTTLVTDELIAAVMEFALMMENPNADSIDDTSFDCTEMYAADGRTFGEWGISPTAIRVQAYSSEHSITPLSQLFSVTRHQDLGIVHAHAHAPQKTLDTTSIQSILGGSHGSNADAVFNEVFPLGLTDGTNSSLAYATGRGTTQTPLNDGMHFPCGYVPKTVLHISTKYHGTNANTATPTLVDSRNVDVNTDVWRQNLRGERCQFWPGDHILPMLNNGRVEIAASSTLVSPFQFGFTDGSGTPQWWMKLIDATGTSYPNQEHQAQELFQFGPIARLKNETTHSVSPAGSAHMPFDDGSTVAEDASYVEPHIMWIDDTDHALLVPMCGETSGRYASGVSGSSYWDIGYRGSTAAYQNYQKLHFFSRLPTTLTVTAFSSTSNTATESEDFQLKGSGVVATGVSTAAWDNINHRIILDDTPSDFGPDNGTFDGYYLVCDGERAYHTPGTVTFTITYHNKYLEATGGGSSVLAAFEAKVAAAGDIITRVSANKLYLQRFIQPDIEGIRTTGSAQNAEPFTYFRGACDGADHSVPLYFGGGFSGAVLDINDGTDNDYTEFYTHPYSAGPTGCAGIQNANEIMGSHCILDTTALLAMFPGTSYLDQHKGQTTPPFQNEHLQLSPDMAQGSGNIPIANAAGTPDSNPGSPGYLQDSKTVIQTQPSPVILRFGHPFARYEDVQNNDKKTQTTYVIFGPGQSVPTFMQSNYASSPNDSTIYEPSVAISVGCLYNQKLFQVAGGDRTAGNPQGAIVPAYPYHIMANGITATSGGSPHFTMAYFGTPSYAYLPNEVSLGTTTTWDNVPQTGSSSTTKHGWAAKIGWLPPTGEYQVTNYARWEAPDNWEPAQGDPNEDMYNQKPEYGLHFSDHFLRHDYGEGASAGSPQPGTNTWSYGATGHGQPFSPLPQTVITNSTGATTASAYAVRGPTEDANTIPNGPDSKKIYTATAKDFAWHMDGGHPPGGNFLDDRVVRNPQNFTRYTMAYHHWDSGDYGVVRISDNASMFRIGAPMLKRVVDDWAYVQDNYNTGAEGDVDRDIIVIDATRVQNAEELGTVISCAINEWPGTGALKALGGTFLPSFQSAHKQDRYSWVELPMDPVPGGGSPSTGRADHLIYTATAGDFGVSDHMTIGTSPMDPITGVTMTGTGNEIPYPVGSCGVGRVFGDTGVATQRWDNTNPGANKNIASGITTLSNQHDRGFYFYYRGVFNSDETKKNRAFCLADNYRTGMKIFEDPAVDNTYRDLINATSGSVKSRPGMKYLECAVHRLEPQALAVPPTFLPRMHIWTKTGNHRWHNGAFINANTQAETFAHKTKLGYGAGINSPWVWDALSATHVHFNGLHDAVDRTRPIGAVGWAGNQYSMLNSMGYWEKSKRGSANAIGFTVPRGLGAWHPFLSFNPYGPALGCHNANFIGQYQPTTSTDSGNLANYGNSGNPNAPTHWSYTSGWSSTYPDARGTHENHYVVITHESELPLIARADNLGTQGIGDLMSGIWVDRAKGTISPPGYDASGDPSPSGNSGTTAWSADIHAPSRYIAPANGGPYVEAQVPSTLAHPTTNDTKRTAMQWGDVVNGADDLVMADSCAAPTGDLFIGTDWVGLANNYYADVNGIGGARNNAKTGVFDADTEPQRYWHDPVANAGKLGARNFTVEHVVWKRMDGGNLSLPAPNARGMGAVPWTWRKQSGTSNYYKTGETVYGNCRFSFETTNSAMLPVIQAQELSHPQIAAQFPHEIGDVLSIPNEEIQFESITVIDDTGQEHRIEGGSPFGTIIRDFKSITNRTDEGMAPALAGSGSQPNMEIQLPDPDTIPGNIIVRSGFDRVQAYQNETVGTGGLQHPSQPTTLIGKSFDGTGPTDATWPTWENNKWEQIAQDSAFPDSRNTGWDHATTDAPIQTAYEPHDRTLYFHITKHNVSYSKREPVAAINHIQRTALGGGANNLVLRDNITVNQTLFTGTTLDYGGTVHFHAAAFKGAIFGDPREQLKDGTDRWYLVAINSAGKKAIASYTNIDVAGTEFTGVVFDSNWDETFNGADIYPSFYTPAGSARLFAARRMRDHAEVSGNSPDMPRVAWYKLNSGASDNPYELIKAPKLTPMPIPRMGHHYVTPTMRMMPGHLAHPVYQNLWRSHLACAKTAHQSYETETGAEVTGVPGMDPNIWFSNLTPNYPPSDIHGGAFTLMTETKVRFDGYGILASNGVSGDVNSKGGHVVILESNSHYTQTSHFPDPLEVGAYQIVIQPNLFSQQVTGFHQNTPFADTTSPRNAADGAWEGDIEQNLTGQQVATVVGIFHDWATYGATGLVLADALSSDVRGCEIYLNEVMLDIDPAPGQQFTTLPPLATFNPLGVNESTSPAFSRRSMPYHPHMFKRATPGYTLTIPWWAIGKNSGGHSGLSLIGVDDYYQFCRATYGAISAQITLAGYPSYGYDPYQREHQSLNPICYIAANPTAGASATVLVDDNSLFPLSGSIYNRLLVVTDSIGREHYATYTTRGTSGASTGDTDRFNVVVPIDGGAASSPFWKALTAGDAFYKDGIIRLTGPHHNYEPGDILTKPKISPLTRILPQVLSGTRDTNNLFLADAYLCMWHHNLGRPFTAFSEGRTTAATPVHQKPYNIMPESFEMVHYHEFAYAISTGPFALGMKWFNHRVASGVLDGAWNNGTGTITLDDTPSDFGADTTTFDGYYLMVDGIRAYHTPGTVTFTIAHGAKTLQATGGAASVSTVFEGLAVDNAIVELIKDDGTGAVVTPSAAAPNPPVTMPSGAEFFFGGFWPGGSRYGAGASRLDMWGDVERGWNVAANPFDGSCVAYVAQYNGGPVLDPMEVRTDQVVTSAWTNYNTTPHNGAPWTRNYCFGYRFSVRQPYNRPRWATAIKSIADASSGSHSNGHYAYYNGPFVQSESGTWTSRKATPVGSTAITPTITGILERQTNASNLLGFDFPGWQVRYSDGRRMTRPFGCPVRTLRNHSLSRRQFPGDNQGLAIEDVAKANMYYVVDWWGNTTGEDVRRFPVRGFGLRPAFDPEAWRWVAPGSGGDITQRPETLFHLHSTAAMPPSVQEGNRNETNNNEYSATMANRRLTDLFNPLDSIRVGDRGDGRGVRCPIFFNEYVAQAVDTTINPLGMMLSYHTAEPPFTMGLIRARDDTLQNTEIPRGITGRLGISDASGLLKKEGTSGRNVEESSGIFGMEGLTFQDPVSRLSPRIGLDTMTVGEMTGGASHDYIIQATQALSLHTDREVGQRYIFEGSFKHTMFPRLADDGEDDVTETTQALGHLDFSKTASMTWADPPSILRFNNAHGVSPLGGNYIMEVSSYTEPFDDAGWGIDTSNAAYVLSTFGPTSNPYQSNATAGVNDPMRRRTNAVDTTVRFLVRPYRALDYRHVALFRPVTEPYDGPQASSTKPFFKHTAGSRYGLFNYEMVNGRAATSGRFVLTTNPSPTTAPYVASYIPNQSNYSDNKSHGPKIIGAGNVGGVISIPTLGSPIARLLISENTLQHYRSDASRRQTIETDEEDGGRSDNVIRPDYTVQPRYSQSLHPKGEGGTTDFNTSDHNDDTPDDYTHVRTVDY